MKTERQTTFKLLPIIFSYQANRIVGQENIIILTNKSVSLKDQTYNFLTNKSVFLNEQFRKLSRGVYEERSPSHPAHPKPVAFNKA